MASPAAKKDAEELLRLYSAEKSRPIKHTEDDDKGNGEVDMSYSTALAEGGILGQSYSDKKRKLKGYSSPQRQAVSSEVSAPSSIQSDEAVDAIRRALFELNDLNHEEISSDAKERIPVITKLLHDVEGHLEAETEHTSTIPYAKKIIFSPVPGGDMEDNQDEEEDRLRILSSSEATPHSKHVLKVYMKNQLDLQESEWEGYEETFNAIAEQLDVMTAERDALLEEKAQWEILRTDYSRVQDELRDMEQMCLEANERSRELEERLVLTLNEQGGDRERVQQLERTIESLETQLHDSEHEYDLLSEATEQKGATITSLERELGESRAQIQQLQAESVQSSTALREELEDVRGRLNEAEARREGGVDTAMSIPDATTPRSKVVLSTYMKNHLDLQEKEWEQYEETVTGLVERLEKSEAALAVVEDEKIRLEREVENLQALLKELQEESHEQTVDALQELKSQIEAANNRLVERDATVVALQNECDVLREAEAKARREVDDLLSSTASSSAHLQSTYEDRVREYDREINRLRVQLEDVSRDYETLEFEKQSFSDIIAERDAEIGNLEQALQLQGAEMSKLAEELQVYQTEKNEMELMLRKKEVEIDELLRYKGVVAEELAAVHAKSHGADEEHKAKIRELEQAVRELRFQVDDRECLLVSKEDEFAREAESRRRVEDEWSNRVTDLENDVASLKSLIAEKDLLIANHKEEHRREIDDKQAAVDLAQDQIVHLEAHVAELRAKVADQSGEDGSLTELQRLGGRIEQLEVQNSELELALSNRGGIDDESHAMASELESLRVQIADLQKQVEMLTESGMNKDSTIRRMKDLFTKSMQTSPTSSLPGSPRQMSPSMRSHSMDDHDRILQAMEKKVQVQICHLQSLQDSLSDEKARCKSLQDHKRALLEKVAQLEGMVSERDGSLQEATLKSIEASNREQSLIHSLDEANAKVIEREKQIDDLNAQLRASSELVDSMQQQNAKLRESIEEKTNALSVMNSSVALARETPGTIARAESRADKINARLNALEQEMSELKSINSALETKLLHKSARADDLAKEVARLRATVTAKTDELCEMRARDLRVEAELQAQLMEKERTAESLRDLIQRMEDNKKEAELLLDERLRKLLAEQDMNKQLRHLLMVINEKDNTTEELLREVQAQGGSLSQELQETTLRLNQETSRCDVLQQEVEVLRKRLADSDQTLAVYQTTHHKAQEVSEGNSRVLREQLHESDNIIAAKEATIEDLRRHLIDLEEDNESLRECLSQQEQALRLDLQGKDAVKRSMVHMSDEATYMQRRFEHQVSSFESTVDQWTQRYTERVEGVSLKINSLLSVGNQRDRELRLLKEDNAELHREKQRWNASRDEMQSTIATCRENIRTLELAAERKQLEMTELQHRLEAVLNRNTEPLPVGGGREREKDVDRESSIDADSHTAVTILEEFTRLAERFEVTEKRALEMSAQGAKTFAKATKGMAFLQEENARLITLVDHFRLVNAKLLGDVKAASSAGAQSSTMKIRFRMLEQELQTYIEKCAALELEVEEKETALLEAVEEAHEMEEARNDRVEDELRGYQTKIREMQEEISAHGRTISRLTSLNESLQGQLEMEMEAAQRQSEAQKREIDAETARADVAESFASTLRANILQLERQKADMQNELEKSQRALSEKQQQWERLQTELYGELELKGGKIKDLQEVVTDQKAQLRGLEDDVANRDNKIEALSARLRDADSEFEECLSKLNSTESLLEQSAQKCVQLEDKVADLSQFLDEARQQISDQDNEVRAATSKQLKAEDRNRKLISEKQALEAVVEDLRSRNDSIMDTSNMAESKADELQFDLTQARNEIELLESELLDKKSEIIHLKSKLETTGREVLTKDKEIRSLEAEVASLKLKADRVAEIQQQLKAKEREVEEYGQAEGRIVLDMQAVTSRLDAVLSASKRGLVSRSGNESVMGTPAHGDSRGRTEFFDLLATPLKTLLTPSRDLISVTRVGDSFSEDSTSSSYLTNLKHNFEKIIVMADEHLQRTAQLEETNNSYQLQLTEVKKSLDQCDQKYRSAAAERDALLSRLTAAENELDSLSDELEAVITERDNALCTGEEYAQWVRLIRRDMEGIMGSDDVSNAMSLASSVVPKIEVVKSDSAQSSRALVDNPATAHPLQDAIITAADTVTALCRGVRGLYSTLTSKDSTLNKLEVQLVNMQQTWEMDKQKLQLKAEDLSAALDREQSMVAQTKAELSAFRAENDKLKHMVAEYSQQSLAMEDDLKNSADNVNELKQAVKEAEVLCMDLRGRIRLLSSEKEELSNDLSSTSNDLAFARTKISNLELQVEQWSSDAGRVKAERDSLIDVRNALQMEVQSARSEASMALEKARTRSSDEDVRASFELERLLAAFSATMDHLHGTFDSSRTTADSNTESLNRSSSDLIVREIDSTLTNAVLVETSAGSIVGRVEHAVKRLAELRSWAREDRRNKRQMEDKIHSLQHELESVKLSSQQDMDEMRLKLKQHDEKEKSMMQRMQTFDVAKAQVGKLEEELQRLRRERDLVNSTMDNEKKSLYKALSSIQQKDSEIDNLKSTVVKLEAECGDLKEGFAQLERSLDEARDAGNKKEEVIRSMKVSSSRQQDTVERLEATVERIKKEKAELEKKIKSSTDGSTSSLACANNRVRELEKDIHEINRSHREKELGMEERLQSLRTENSDLLSKVNLLESRLSQATSEATTYRRESSTAAQEIQRLQNKLERDAAEHKKVMAAMSALQNLEEDWRLQAEGTTALMEEEESRCMRAESRVKELESQLEDLKTVVTQKEATISSERERRLRAEQDVQRQLILLERTQRELALNSGRASALRAEGRKARKEVLEAAEYLREVAGIMQTSAVLSDSRSSVENIDSVSTFRGDNSRPDQCDAENRDSDTLGAKEISSVLQTIKNLTEVVRKVPQSHVTFESNMRRLESENSRLQRELEGIEIIHEDRLQRLHAEIRQLEEQLRVTRGRDVVRTQVPSQDVAHLEQEIALLRDKCDRADRKEKECLLEIASLSEELERLRKHPQRVAPVSSETVDTELVEYVSKREHSSEVEYLNREVKTLREELDAVRHHRTVLQDSVSQLEGLVYRDETKDNSRESRHLNHRWSSADNSSTDQDFEYLRRQLVRYQRKQQATDELVSIYRKGLLGLYADGSFYGRLQHAGLKESKSSAVGVEIGWIEKDIALVRQCYLEEIELLEGQCDDLLVQIKQGESYRSELRVRLEDTLRALYRGSKGQVSEVISHQLEHMSSDLQSGQQQILSLTNQLSLLQRQGRMKCDKMVEDFAKALQGRDDALRRIKSMEDSSKKSAEASTATYQALTKELNETKSLVSRLRNEIDENNRLIKEKDRAVVQLRRELIDVDTQLETERKKRAALRKELSSSRPFSGEEGKEVSIPSSVSLSHVPDDESGARRVIDKTVVSHTTPVKSRPGDPETPPSIVEARKRSSSIPRRLASTTGSPAASRFRAESPYVHPLPGRHSRTSPVKYTNVARSLNPEDDKSGVSKGRHKVGEVERRAGSTGRITDHTVSSKMRTTRYTSYTSSESNRGETEGRSRRGPAGNSIPEWRDARERDLPAAVTSHAAKPPQRHKPPSPAY